MMNILILGGGFAGVAAAKKIGFGLGHREDVQITLIDRNRYTTMLPSLPDVAGNRVEPHTLTEEITKLIPEDVQFLEGTVAKVSLPEKKVYLSDGKVQSYDYLILSGGSKTNFYGKDETLKLCHKMDCFEDALKIRDDAAAFMDSHPETHFVISGSGFTGIELAMNLNHALIQKGKPGSVSLVEVADRILPMLSPDMSKYTKDTVERMGIQFKLCTDVTAYDGETITYKDGSTQNNVFYAWCAGVMNSISVEGNQQELKDKRIIVDEFLRIPEHPEVFVAGDSAAVKDKTGNFIRRAVNFAYMQGGAAGANLIRTVHNEPLKPFKSIDLGWVIPLYVSSIGVAMGVNMKGRLGIPFHYIMCGIKNYNFSNFMSYLGYGFRFFFTKAPKR